jgi:cytoskeleton protein RodZ
MSDVEQPATPSETTEAPVAPVAHVSPGELLRQAREKAGLSPDQVAKDMLLDTRIVRAIEVDRFSEVGAPVYAKGYLRRYAKLVGVAESSVLASYDALLGPGAVVDPVPVSHNVIPPPRRALPQWVWWLVVAVVVLVAVVKIAELQNDPILTQQAPPAPAQTSVDAQTVVTADSAATPLEQAAAFSSATNNATDKLAANDSVTLTLRFTGNSWVEVYGANNQTLMYDMGTPDMPREVSGKPPLRVTLGSASLVSVSINDRVRNLPAEAVQANVAHFIVNAAGDIE